MSFELPEGISHSTSIYEIEEEIVPFDHHFAWECSHCQLSLEAFLLTPNGRYEGLIRNAKTQVELWNNKLPRQREKALKLLEENFSRKVENHRKVH